VHKIQILLSGVLLSSALLLPAGASAQAAEAEAGVHKIGLVNLNIVFKEYEGTKSQEAKLEKISTEKHAEREKIVSEIRNMRDELALLNDANRDKQRQAIEQKLKDLAQFDQQARDLLREQREEAIQALLKEIEGIVNDVAKQKGLDLVLTDRAALYFTPGIDITQEILSILNQKYSKKS